MRELNREVHSQASRMDGPVIFPSRLWVTRRNGIRRIDGKMPK